MPTVCTPLPRERLAIIAIDTELCPFVLDRVLGIFVAREVTAFTIRIRRIAPVQKIEVEIDNIGEAARPIVYLMCRLPMVRSVHAVRYADRQDAAPPMRAKL